MTKNSVSRATLAAARNAISSSRFFMRLPDCDPFALTQDARKRSGLAEPSRHGSIAEQKSGNLRTGQPAENPIPFQENRSDASSISSHPAAEIAPCKHQHARIAAELASDHTILGCVDPINDCMRSLLHSPSVAHSWPSRNNICKDLFRGKKNEGRPEGTHNFGRGTIPPRTRDVLSHVVT